MKTVLLIISISLGVLKTDITSNKIGKVFKEFQEAIVKNDCKKIIELSNFPIEGDAGLARLIIEDDFEEQMRKYNFQIPKELLIKNCLFLEEPELKLLTQFNFNKQENNKEVLYKGCVYKSYLHINEDKNSFQWSVGCVDLIEESIGEYSINFTFKLIDGEYKLKQIHGVG